MTKRPLFDVTIVGGSYAGLSAAMALGRSLRNVLLIDSGQPCNRQTPHSHNFLTHDGATPRDIAVRALQQVLAYDTVTRISGTARNAWNEEGYFLTELDSGERYASKKLLFATGVKDVLPDIAGLAACWGISVLHCPYCHGYEVRNEKIGLLGNGDAGFELAKLLSNWTNDLTLYTNGASSLSAEQQTKLAAHDIRVDERKISRLNHTGGYVNRIVFQDGTSEPLRALFARGTFEQHCTIPITLGCELTEQGYLKVDDFQRTTVPGVYAAGDNTTMLRSVAAAVAAGNKAGAVLNRELIEEEF
jgi:thioredoxin reductase